MAFEKFHFKTTDDDVIIVPFAQNLFRRKRYKELIKEYQADPNSLDDAMFDEAKFEKKTLDQIDNMLLVDYNAFVQGWMGDPQASPGESSAS